MITERYQKQIKGILSCYDRIVVHGNVIPWGYADGMTSYLYSHNIRIFDFPQFAHPLREEVRKNAEQVARDNALTIEHIRKTKSFRKEDRIRKIIEQRGDHPGLVHIFSAMEACTTYQPWHDKKSGKTFLRPDGGQCLHYYFYFIDRELGLCYLRVPSWVPFRVQFYCNGHHWLAHRLCKKQIPFVLRENAFLSIADFPAAQKLSDQLRVKDFHQVFDLYARMFCPVVERLGCSYHFSIMQAEYATDILFHRQKDLTPLYENLVRTAIHSVKPENIATFLGRKLSPLYQGEMGNTFNTRIQGTRIKHQMGAVSLKMYDKYGIILRIETSTNNVSHLQCVREVRHRNGQTTRKRAPMLKSIYSLYPLAKLCQAANRRYLEYISSFDDPSQGITHLHKVSRDVSVENRNYKGFNFFSAEDLSLFTVLCRGEFNISGLRNKDLRHYLPWSTGKTSRMLKRLRLHGLVKRVAGSYKYYLTKLGKRVILAGFQVKELFIVPRLAGIV